MPAALDVERAAARRQRRMRVADRKPDPGSLAVAAGLVVEAAVDHEQLCALTIGAAPGHGAGGPALERRRIGIARLRIEQPGFDAARRARFPGQGVGVDRDLVSVGPRELPQLDDAWAFPGLAKAANMINMRTKV